MTIHLTVRLRSYIGHPYWPEMERLVNVIKESGMSRARSAANRRKALEEHLRSTGMSLAEYDALEQAANRPWHLGDHGRIIIPKMSVESMLVAANDIARSAQRACPPDMVRSVLRVTDWTTDAEPDIAREWVRYAVVTSGTGAKLSNQRGLRRNQYIGDDPPVGEPTAKVTATGTIDHNPDMVRPDQLFSLLRWAGEWVGIGASRKMGWGRFELLET